VPLSNLQAHSGVPASQTEREARKHRKHSHPDQRKENDIKGSVNVDAEFFEDFFHNKTSNQLPVISDQVTSGEKEECRV
jgi:hypothetical protein